MKKLTKLMILVLCFAFCIVSVAGLTACVESGSETVKIGVLVADASGAEALAFKNYYESYVSGQYDVEFIYSAALEDAAGAKAQVETFISQNCKAIIDMADKDRAGLAEYCNGKKVYYAIASGMMDDESFNKCKGYEYFIGQIGPDMATEYQAGLKMGEYYASKNVKNVGIYGAFIPNPMHSYRLAGVLTGLGLTYDGASGMDIVAKIGVSVDATKIAGNVNVQYMAGYGDSTSDEISAIINAKVDAYLSVGMTTTFFAAQLNQANIPYGDIDAFTSSNQEHMTNGKLNYLAGKYASSIGPVFAAIMSAVNGAPIRDNGNAISINQNYGVAKSATEFATMAEGSTPIYDKALLDTIIGTKNAPVSYEAFKAVVDAH